VEEGVDSEEEADSEEAVFEAVDLEEEAEEVFDHMAVVRVEDHLVERVPDV
jgi:hypothetical protein